MPQAVPNLLWTIARNLKANSNGAYDPDPATGVTHCNAYFYDFANAGWGYNGLLDANGNRQLANDIIASIRTAIDWTVLVDKAAPFNDPLQAAFDDARTRAGNGQLVLVAVQSPPGPNLHGHLNIVLPVDPTVGPCVQAPSWAALAPNSVPWVAQAGAAAMANPVCPDPATHLGWCVAYARTQTPGWCFFMAALTLA